METTIILFLTSTIISIVVALILKFNLRDKINNKIKPVCYNIGVFISKFLILRIGKKSAEKVEEGIIVTFLDLLANAFAYIRDGLIADNDKKINETE